jgi:photoactive yellow protein
MAHPRVTRCGQAPRHLLQPPNTMNTNVLTAATFEQPELLAALAQMDEAALDDVGFGVIGFDADCIVRRYGATESRLSGLRPERVLGLNVFSVVAQCMNNFLVAQRFEDSLNQGKPLDARLDFVLTLRMKPTKVKLRLLAEPAHDMRYVCILR